MASFWQNQHEKEHEELKYKNLQNKWLISSYQEKTNCSHIKKKQIAPPENHNKKNVIIAPPENNIT